MLSATKRSCGGDVAQFNYNWPKHPTSPTVWKPFSKLQTPMVNTYCQLRRYTLPLKMCLFTPLQWKPIFCRVLPVTGHHVGLKGRLKFYWLKESPLIWHSSMRDVLCECETKCTKNQYSLVVKVSLNTHTGQNIDQCSEYKNCYLHRTLKILHRSPYCGLFTEKSNANFNLLKMLAPHYKNCNTLILPNPRYSTKFRVGTSS